MTAKMPAHGVDTEPLLDALSHYMLTGSGDPHAELEKLTPALQSTASVAELAELKAVTDRTMAARRMLLQRGTNIGRTEMLVRVSEVRTLLARLTTPFTKSDDLHDAHARLSALQAEYDAALTQLEKAVDVADLDTVVALRPQVEVSLPTAIADAQLVIAELEAERAQTLSVRPQAELDVAQQVEAAARDRLTAAHLEIEAAQAAVFDAQGVVQAAQSQVAAAATHARQASERHQAMQNSHQREARARLRRLAGLPPEDDAAEPQMPEQPTPSMIGQFILGAAAGGEIAGTAPNRRVRTSGWGPTP
jgi:hypothetical protein